MASLSNFVFDGEVFDNLDFRISNFSGNTNISWEFFSIKKSLKDKKVKNGFDNIIVKSHLLVSRSPGEGGGGD